MNDKVKQLYDLYVSNGLIKSVDFNTFSNASEEQRSQLYNLGRQNGLFETTDFNTFSSAFGGQQQGPAPYATGKGPAQVEQPTKQEPLKKKEPTSLVSSSATTPSVSQEEPPKITDYLQQPAEETKIQAPYAEGKEPVFIKKEGEPVQNLRQLTEEQYASEQQKAIESGKITPAKISGKETFIPTIETKNLPKEDLEENYFKGSFGNVLKGFDEVVPLGIGDFIDDMARSVSSGYRQGVAAKDADRLLLKGSKATPEQIQKFIESQKAIQQSGPSAEMQDYQRIYEKEGKGFWGVIKGLISNPSVIPELITSSLTAMATNTDALTAASSAIGTGASIGAAAGAPAGGIGAIPGAAAGATASIPYAFGLASSIVEAGSTFGELIQEELNGQEFTKENVKKILEDPTKLNKIRNKAIARGLIIGTVDAFTGKLASGVGAKIIERGAAKSATGVATRGTLAKATAAGAGVEALGGSGGEAIARGATGQEMDISEISLEGLAELPSGIRSTIQARLTKPTFRVNGERVNADQVDELINTMTPDELSKTNIEIKNDFEGRKNKIQDKIITGQIKKEVQQANPNIEDNDLNQLVDLEKELRSFENNKTQSGKDRAADIRLQIKNIQQNAVQKQAAGQVPVQPTTGVSEKVEEGKPTTESEVVTEEGIEETVAPKKEVGQIGQFLVEGISGDVGGYESYTEKKAGDLRGELTYAKDRFTSSDGVEMQGGIVEKESEDGKDRIITLGVNKTSSQGGEVINGKLVGGTLVDHVGRNAYYSVSVSVPKESKTTAEDVKQMLVDKAAQIAEESKKQNPKLKGIAVSALKTTSKEVAMPKAEAKVEAEVTPTVLANVENTSTALESVPVEEKMDLEFTQDDGTVSPVNGNERMLSDMYHKAVALPEDQRTEPQKQVVSLVEQSLSNDIEVERLERELAKPEVTEGPVTTVGISISNDTEIENLKNTARSKAQEAKTNEEKQSAETKVKILETAQRAIKAIKNIFPDIDIVIHDNEESYNNEVRRLQGQEGSGGNFAIITDANGKETRRIDINLSKANERTVAHETAHALLEKAFGDDPKLFQRFKDAISKILSAEKNEELNKFIERYTNKEVRPEEYLVELAGMLEQQETTVAFKPSTLQKIAELINKFVSAITNGKLVPFRNVKDTKEIVEFLNTISGAIREGKEVQLSESGVSFNIGDPTVISKSQEVGEKIEFKKEPYQLSFVTEADKIDINKLIDDIIAKKQKVWFWMADQLGRGKYYDEVINGEHYLDAGPSFALDPKNRSKNILWASGLPKATLAKKVSDADYIFFISGSPEKAKLFNKRVLDLIAGRINKTSNFDDFKNKINSFPKETNELKTIKNALSKVNSFEELSNSPRRKDFLLAINDIGKLKTTPEGSLKELLNSFNVFIDYNELRDGFYRENNFSQNDIMLVGKPTGVKEKAPHSTYQNAIIGKVVGVPDTKINAWELMPQSLKNQYIKSISISAQAKVIAAEQGKVRVGTEKGFKEAKPKVKSKSQQPEPTPAPKYVRDISVLITPATVRGFDTRTERIKDMSIKYDKLVKEYATDKSEEKRIQIKELEDQILNDAKQEIIDEVNKIPGLAVKFEQPRIGLWDGAFEPSFNMTFSVTPQADTKKISDLLMEFGEKYSQDAFILETQSEQHNDFVNGKIRMPLNEEDSNGLANYPQIIYTFAEPISDEKISELSTSLQANGIDAFSVNNNELKISVLTFLSKEQEQTLSQDEQYAEKFRDFESKSEAAEKSVGDVLGSNALYEGEVVIKKSHYQGANKFEKTDKTRQYDRRDVLKPFQQGTTEVEALSKEFSELRKKQIEGKKLTEQEQARFNELESIIQPVVEKTFEANQKIYEQAKNEVEDIAEKSIEGFDASISPFPIKKPQRASVKTLRWYSGLTENLGDGARVNVIVKTDADADALFDKINEENPVGNDKDLRRINEETDLSYPKRLIEVRTPAGVIAEMQVITEKAYLAKDGMKGFTGGKEQKASAKKELDNVRNILGWNIPDGLGHYFYEIQRDTNIDQDLRDEAKRLSNLYYDAFVNEKSDLKETPFMNDVMKFKERVDKADKKNWDKGNEGKAPESLTGYKVKSKSSLAGKDINNVIKRGRAAGISERAIRTVLKKQGFTDAEIDAAMGAEKGAAKKVTVSEEMLPGFDRMMEQVDGIVAKSRERGVSEDKVMENVMRYVEGSKAYENASDVQREQIIRDIEKRFGVKQKAAPKAEKIIGTIKDTKKVTMSEKDALVKQIKDQARGAKDAKSAMRRSLDFVSRTVKELARSGKISVKQAANVLRKFSSINPLSKESVDRFVDYMSKVFADADYSNKLSFALETKRSISKLSKNKDKDANLRALGEKFSEIDPSMVENIDEYNEMASAIKESIKGSTFRREAVMPAQMVNIQNAMEYVNKTMDSQKKKMTEIKAAEIQEMMGVDVSDLSYDQMMQLLESKEPITKYNEGIIRGTIEKMFNVYSSIINQIIDSGIDPMTGDSAEIKVSKKALVKKFMEMDLSILTPKEALQAVDALNNFLINKSTAKMQTVLSDYTGEANARKVEKKGITAKPLKMYWLSSVGRFFGEQFTALPLLIERMFKGVIAGTTVENAMGVTELKNKKAEAENKSNRIVEEYINKFYKSKSNGEAFDTEANVTERGMAAFMSRSVTGTEEEMQQDFNRRKKLIEESIEALSKGSEKEQAKGKLYQQAYDKILKDSNSVEEVRRNTDKNNLAAIDFWVDNWSSIYDELADVSENVYNKILDKDVNYTPDRFSRLERAKEKTELSNDESVFHGNTNSLYKKETGVLMRAERPESLPKDDKGKKPMMYIDLSFDVNNANSMYDAMVDINTAAPIRQIESFINSDAFDSIVPEVKDARLLKDRIQLYVRNIRGKNVFENDTFAAMMRKLNTISAIGVGQALGGILQPFKQTIPVAMNTLVNAGGLDIGSIFNSSKMNFIDNSGYAIANRGIESQTQLKSINKLMDLAAESKGIKALKYIEKANKIWLDIFLVKPDSFIARASWMSYYEQSLKKQGIDPGDIDYNTHKINKEAADYAQTMVDRQQNISDSDLQGKLFSSKTALSQLFVKTLLPFANFRMNQFMRLTNDITTLTSMTSSKEDKVIAARSLGGYSVEVAAFTAISTAAGMLLYELSKTMMGEGEDEEEEERRKSNMIKGQITGRVTDILSPLPFLDKPIAAGVNMAMDKVQEAMDIVKEDRLSIYGDTKVDMVKSLGTLGITLERGAQLYDLYDLARTGEYTDSYGNVKKISESSRAYLEGMTAAALLTNIGLAPSEVNNIVRNSIKLAKSTGKTEATIEREVKAEENKTESHLLLNELREQETDPELIDAIDKRISELEDKSEVAKEKRKARKEEKERLLQGYKNMDEMKRYDPELYEETFGEGSDYYEKHKDEVLINKAYNKLERQKRDEEMNYIPPPKESKKKKKGFGSEGFGTKGFGSKGFGSKGF